jgi:hypothetical protein
VSKLDLFDDCPICKRKPADASRPSKACSKACETVALRNSEQDLIARFRQLGVERVLKQSSTPTERAYRERIASRAAMSGAL